VGRRADIWGPTVGAQGPRAEQEVTSRHELREASRQARLGAGTVVGAGCWLLTVAYLIVQPVVAAAWEPPYDLAANTISDLGITGCGDFRQFDDRVIYACSPRYELMNTIFVVVGLLTSAGALLTRDIWPRRRLTTVGVAFVVLAGVGGVLTGLAPADVNMAAHGAGALLQVPGALGPLLLGVAARSVRRGVAAFSLLCGVVGSAACVLFFSRSDLGLGLGVMEHLAFDPLTVWTTALGAVLLGRLLTARRDLR
jgi:hypothetical membrane protein